jgi:uncharacterized membrane protein
MAVESGAARTGVVAARTGKGDWVSTSDVGVRQVAFDAPWDWLGAGWRDLVRIPAVSLVYGAVFAFAALLMVLGLLQTGMISLMLAFAGGFLLLGPLVAVGLYEASRRLETGKPVTIADVVGAGLKAEGQLAFFGAIIAFAFAVWLQLAFLMFMLFLGSRGFPPLSEFLPMLLFTANGLGLLVFGSIVGGVLASIVFAVSAIAVPLMLEKKVDAVTAMTVSVRAVVENPKPMALWAVLIAGFMALGLATLLIGFVVAFPLIGHATWHAYRSLVSLPSR